MFNLNLLSYKLGPLLHILSYGSAQNKHGLFFTWWAFLMLEHCCYITPLSFSGINITAPSTVSHRAWFPDLSPFWSPSSRNIPTSHLSFLICAEQKLIVYQVRSDKSEIECCWPRQNRVHSTLLSWNQDSWAKQSEQGWVPIQRSELNYFLSLFQGKKNNSCISIIKN